MNDTRFDKDDAVAVIRDLRRYERLLDELMDRVGAKNFFSPSEREDLREQYTALKSDLKERHRHFNLASVDRELNSTEHAFLSPALRKAYVQLSAPVNSPPTRWRDGLYSAHMDVAFLLRDLEELFPGTTGE